MSLFDLNKCIVWRQLETVSVRESSPQALCRCVLFSTSGQARGHTFLFLDPLDWLSFFSILFFISLYFCPWESLCNFIFQSFHLNFKFVLSVFSNSKVFIVLECSFLIPCWSCFMVLSYLWGIFSFVFLNVFPHRFSFWALLLLSVCLVCLLSSLLGSLFDVWWSLPSARSWKRWPKRSLEAVCLRVSDLVWLLPWWLLYGHSFHCFFGAAHDLVVVIFLSAENKFGCRQIWKVMGVRSASLEEPCFAHWGERGHLCALFWPPVVPVRREDPHQWWVAMLVCPFLIRSPSGCQTGTIPIWSTLSWGLNEVIQKASSGKLNFSSPPPCLSLFSSASLRIWKTRKSTMNVVNRLWFTVERL